MSRCDLESLEAHVRGELPAAQMPQVVDHLSACSACRQEMAELRHEHRLFAERARSQTPPYVQLAKLRGRVDASILAQHRSQRRVKAARSGGAVLSAVAAVLIAFFVASAPGPRHEVQLGWLDPESCSTMEARLFSGGAAVAYCAGPVAGSEWVAAVESQFDACLVATPHAFPGAGTCR